jgi:hypothetical protein
MEEATKQYQKLTRMSGYWDIAIMLPFLLPGVANVALEFLSVVDHTLQLPGTIETFSPIQTLFVNMLAALTIVWSVKRVRTPEPIYGFYDGVSRIMMFVLMIAQIALGASMILIVFVLAELVWASVQISGYYRVKRARLPQSNSNTTTVSHRR